MTQPAPATNLTGKIKRLPRQPGVYLYKDAAGEIIYVGKARNLQVRVRSYFQESRERDPKTEQLVQDIRDVECIVTGSEYEAFLLESNLVHEHRPRYNIDLKDDKSFPFIEITVGEKFPRISYTRRPYREKARYFGPFIPATRARHLIDMVRKFFGIRHCRQEIDGRATRPCCLDYHIQRCLGPCVATLCSPERYGQAVEQAILFLEGKTRELTRRLEEEMGRAAGEQRYEDAALLRDRLAAVRGLAETQQVYLTQRDDADIFGYHHQGDRVAVQVFHLRHSRVVDRRQFFWEDRSGWAAGDFFREFLPQFYVGQPALPALVLVPADVPEKEFLEKWLSEKSGRRVRVRRPQRGRYARLQELVTRNARSAFQSRFAGAGVLTESVERLQAALELPRPPRRIEAFDISNTRGQQIVAAMVMAVDGKMERSRYRKFRIRSVTEQPDDFAAMREVVHRRYARVLQEGGDLPDLVLVDGGAGQVSAARQSLADLGLAGRLPLCGLAKQNEEIYRVGYPEPLRLDRHSPELKLLQRIRDEAHRFAITFHRRRRQQASLASRIDEIPGIGPHRRQRLMRHFGTWPGIVAAPLEELRLVLGPRTGRQVYDYLQNERNTDDEA